MYGPRPLGGTNQPTDAQTNRPFERRSTRVGGGSGRLHQGSVNLGTRQDSWYLRPAPITQSGLFQRLSGRFRADRDRDGEQTADSDHLDIKEIGQARLAAARRRRIRARLTSTSTAPGASHRLSIRLLSPRYWRWPYWDKQSVYLLSTTRLSDSETLKAARVSRHLRQRYRRLGWQLAGAGQVLNTTTGELLRRQQRRLVEAGENRRLAGPILKALVYAKRDTHRESDSQTNGATFRDSIGSLALEGQFRLGSNTAGRRRIATP